MQKTSAQTYDVSYGLLPFVRALTLTLVALHLLGPRLPEAAAWGLWPYGYLALPLQIALAVLVALTCVPQVNQRMRDALALAGAPLRNHARLTHTFIQLLPLLVLPWLYLFRIVHTRWGDAYILTNAIPDKDAHLMYSWQAPLDVYIHARFWALGHDLFAWKDAMPAYAILSVLAGGVFLWILLRLVRLISDNRLGQVVALTLFATLGSMQLFFGYVENYTFVTVLILAYLWQGLLCLRGQAPVWLATLILGVANATHPSTIVLGPSMLYLGWMRAQRAGKGFNGRSLLSSALQIALPIVLVGGATFLLMGLAGHGIGALASDDKPGGGDGRWFVELLQTTDRWEHYTLFSLGHLLDMLNEQLLVAPTILPLGILLLVMARASSVWRSVEVRFASVAAAFFLLLIWTWNADYGGQRDWDLFSLALIPLTLWVALVLLYVVRNREHLAEIGLMLGALSLVHTASWVYQNTLPWNWN